jgi:hypothetical protein
MWLYALQAEREPYFNSDEGLFPQRSAAAQRPFLFTGKQVRSSGLQLSDTEVCDYSVSYSASCTLNSMQCAAAAQECVSRTASTIRL